MAVSVHLDCVLSTINISLNGRLESWCKDRKSREYNRSEIDWFYADLYRGYISGEMWYITVRLVRLVCLVRQIHPVQPVPPVQLIQPVRLVCPVQPVHPVQLIHPVRLVWPVRKIWLFQKKHYSPPEPGVGFLWQGAGWEWSWLRYILDNKRYIQGVEYEKNTKPSKKNTW